MPTLTPRNWLEWAASTHTRLGRTASYTSGPVTAGPAGTGILPEDLSRIFEKGFTGSNGRARERSTGMGLYLCRKLCRKLGVGISAESWYGEGTKMMLEFPVSNYVVNCSK
ncbi:MAG: hypothetical protein HFF23_10685 [Oscillospiraceae bacterium]|nr:hypothetical protein [Oscillospiraceae bacterium]